MYNINSWRTRYEELQRWYEEARVAREERRRAREERRLAREEERQAREEERRVLEEANRAGEEGRGNPKSFHDFVQFNRLGKCFTDLSLLTANINQLVFILMDPQADFGALKTNLLTIFLSASIVFNMIAWILLIIEFRMRVIDDNKICNRCQRLCTIRMCISFVVIALNFFVAALGGTGLPEGGIHETKKFSTSVMDGL